MFMPQLQGVLGKPAYGTCILHQVEGRGRVAFEPATSGVCDKYLARRILRIRWLNLFNLFVNFWLTNNAYIAVMLCQALSNINLLTPNSYYDPHFPPIFIEEAEALRD